MCVLGVDQGVVSCVSLLYTLEWGMGVVLICYSLDSFTLVRSFTSAVPVLSQC